MLLDRRDDSVKALAQISGICQGSGSTSRLLTGCSIIVRSDLEGKRSPEEDKERGHLDPQKIGLLPYDEISSFPRRSQLPCFNTKFSLSVVCILHHEKN